MQEYINGAEGTYEADLTAVGHIQSGGDPTSTDRILASRLGSAAVEAPPTASPASWSGCA